MQQQLQWVYALLLKESNELQRKERERIENKELPKGLFFIFA